MGQPFGDLAISKGLLLISYQGGSREAFSDVLKWRYDSKKRKFILIGETNQDTDTIGDEPTDRIDINYATMTMERRVGRRKKSCSVPAAFRTLELTSFDYEGKHFDDLYKLVKHFEVK